MLLVACINSYMIKMETYPSRSGFTWDDVLQFRGEGDNPSVRWYVDNGGEVCLLVPHSDITIEEESFPCTVERRGSWSLTSPLV